MIKSSFLISKNKIQFYGQNNHLRKDDLVTLKIKKMYSKPVLERDSGTDSLLSNQAVWIY